MRDRRNAVLLGRVKRVQDLERLTAERALVDARTEENARLSEAREAKDRLDDAVKEWSHFLDGAKFDPDSFARRASALLACDQNNARAEDKFRAAERETARRQEQTAFCAARLRQTDKELARLRRRLALRREEKALAKTEERTSYDWMKA